MVLTTDRTIEKIMIGDIEAVGIHDDAHDAHQLIWIQDGRKFHIYAQHDLETSVRIAESIYLVAG
jgi:hypothetical protein